MHEKIKGRFPCLVTFKVQKNVVYLLYLGTPCRVDDAHCAAAIPWHLVVLMTPIVLLPRKEDGGFHSHDAFP